MRSTENRSSKQRRIPLRSRAAARGTAATALSTLSTTKPVSPSSITSGTEPLLNATTGVPLAIASIMENQRHRPTDKFSFVAVTDLTDELHPRTLEQSFEFGIVVIKIRFVDLGRDFHRDSGAAGNFDRLFHPLLGADAADKSEVAAVSAARKIKIRRKAVMNSALPARPGHRCPLSVRDGHQWHHRKFAKEGLQVRKIKAAMGRRHGLAPEPGKRWKMQKIRMKVDDVECFGAPHDAVQHHQMMRKRILALRIEAQCAITRGPQYRPGLRVAAGKQSDLMTLPYQLFGQIRDDPLGAAVKLRRTALVQR